MEQLQSGMKYLVSAGETGRRNLDGMLAPVNGAISEISGATAELEGLPIVGRLPLGRNFNASCEASMRLRRRLGPSCRCTAEHRGR
ncbi:Phage protein U [Pseudomonas savastanoi pv. phaseolicola]|nr:Phage protein U [Pseudomonas savastanoi pv. phaseolicola]